MNLNKKYYPKHKIIIKENGWRYLCNQAVSPINAKSCLTWKGVTCKNCLRGYKDD